MSESSAASPDSSLSLSPMSNSPEAPAIKPLEAPIHHELQPTTSFISPVPITASTTISASSASQSFRPGRDDGSQMFYNDNGLPFPKAPVVPRRGRHTNQLQFLAHTVLPTVINHQHAWPFRQPVDPYLLKLPLYFDV